MLHFESRCARKEPQQRVESEKQVPSSTDADT